MALFSKEMRTSMNLSKQELYEIAISDIPLHHRYIAARELQNRRITDDKLIQIVRLAPSHLDSEIAEIVGLRIADVRGFLNKHLRRVEI